MVKYAKNFNIEGGGLKTWVETRWTTMFDAADSVLRLKLALEKVIKNINLSFINLQKELKYFKTN